MWAMLVNKYLSDALTSILRHWQRLGNQGVVEYPMVPFGTVSLAVTQVSLLNTRYIHTDYIIQTLHIVRSWVYNLNAKEDPDPSRFDCTYNAIYNYLSWDFRTGVEVLKGSYIYGRTLSSGHGLDVSSVPITSRYIHVILFQRLLSI